VEFDSSDVARALESRLVCRDLSPRQSPTRQTYVARGGVAQLVRLVRLCVGICRTKMSPAHATRQTCVRSKVACLTSRMSDESRSLAPTKSDSYDFIKNREVSLRHGPTRQTCVRSKVRPTRRLVRLLAFKLKKKSHTCR
jgi:hypothetical protein